MPTSKAKTLPSCTCNSGVIDGHSLNCPIRQDLADQLNYLSECDHGILGGDVARRIAVPFNFLPTTTRIQDRRSEFKGAYFPHLKEGQYATDVLPASLLATQICHQLGIDYPVLNGEGAQLHACVRAIREHLGIVPPTVVEN